MSQDHKIDLLVGVYLGVVVGVILILGGCASEQPKPEKIKPYFELSNEVETKLA